MSKLVNWFKEKSSQLTNWVHEKKAQFNNWWNNSKIVKDFTGQTAIDQQNAANMELARYQAQMNEDFYNKYSSPESLMRQYREAGLNPNLVYGSVGSGQGNVPSFNAPQVERNMSGADKINKALSSFSAGLGLVQNVYQVAAARESAQQAMVKTANDYNQFNDNFLTYLMRQREVGTRVDTAPFKLFSKFTNRPTTWNKNDLFDRYIGASRSQHMNKALEASMKNIYQFGMGHYGLDDKLHLLDSGLMPYQRTLNLHSKLKYDLTREIGNTGTYGKLLLSALGLFL